MGFVGGLQIKRTMGINEKNPNITLFWHGRFGETFLERE